MMQKRIVWEFGAAVGGMVAENTDTDVAFAAQLPRLDDARAELAVGELRQLAEELRTGAA